MLWVRGVRLGPDAPGFAVFRKSAETSVEMLDRRVEMDAVWTASVVRFGSVRIAHVELASHWRSGDRDGWLVTFYFFSEADSRTGKTTLVAVSRAHLDQGGRQLLGWAHYITATGEVQYFHTVERDVGVFDTNTAVVFNARALEFGARDGPSLHADADVKTRQSVLPVDRLEIGVRAWNLVRDDMQRRSLKTTDAINRTRSEVYARYFSDINYNSEFWQFDVEKRPA